MLTDEQKMWLESNLKMLEKVSSDREQLEKDKHKEKYMLKTNLANIDYRYEKKSAPIDEMKTSMVIAITNLFGGQDAFIEMLKEDKVFADRFRKATRNYRPKLYGFEVSDEKTDSTD